MNILNHSYQLILFVIHVHVHVYESIMTDWIAMFVVSIKQNLNCWSEYTCIFNQLSAVKAGNLTEDEVRQMVKPLFYTRMRLGEWLKHEYKAIQ